MHLFTSMNFKSKYLDKNYLHSTSPQQNFA